MLEILYKQISFKKTSFFNKKIIEINILLIKIEDKNHYNKIKNDNRSFEPNFDNIGSSSVMIFEPCP